MTSTAAPAAAPATAVRYDRDADGVVTLTLDDPAAGANTMNEAYQQGMHAAVERLYAELDEVAGVILASGKPTFFAGADLKGLVGLSQDDAADLFRRIEAVKADLRRLETFPRPVVAAVNGAALGGGFEIALACRRRIAAEGRYEVGLPEVTLGLLPGGGGVTRVVRMLGLQTALTDVLVPGTRFRPSAALEKGLVDEVVPADRLLDAAREWVLAHRDDPAAAASPWDRPGFRIPGGTPSTPALARQLPAFPALLRQQLKGAPYAAPRAILSAAVEGAQVDFDTASRIESRHLTRLVLGQQAKNMIQAFFFDLQAIGAGRLRPAGVPPYRARKVGVLGAGMMGAGIAHVCARAGMEVVLKDVTVDNAERGRRHSADLLDRAVAKGRLTEAQRAEVLDRIRPTADAGDLAGCDLVVEAVFEDPSLKARVYAEAQPHLAPGALVCSNTSTLPISGLAAGVDRPADFIGLHFFSPVDKMPLVEIIRGEQTSDEALARAYDVVQQIRKTPIVVNDSRGFYTSRVIGMRVNEGLAMLAEGVHPVSLERAATQAGYPVGPLQLSDELNLELMAKIRDAGRAAVEASGAAYTPHPGERVIDAMIELGRPSRLKGAGFYEYADGRRRGLWPGLAGAFPVAAEQPPLADMADRMLFTEALETAACFEEGVLTSAAAANIGSIMGLGFPPYTGGTAQLMTGYESRTGEVGLAAFVRRADELADRYGDRFRPSDRLREMAASGESFPR